MFVGDIAAEVTGEVVPDVDDGVVEMSDRARDGSIFSWAFVFMGWRRRTLLEEVFRLG